MADATDPDQLAARLQLELQQCWQRGERVRVESYLQQYPALLAAEEQLLDLLYHEVLLREQFGEYPGVTEYVERFPQFERQLRRQFLVHQALASSTVQQIDDSSGNDNHRDGLGRVEDLEAKPGIEADRLHIRGYEILGEIGRGGMGIVYRARQLSLNRVVALKMILDGPHASRRHVDRFRAEAQVVAMLQHPNIVQIYEVGEHEGKPYLALEFVDGVSLAQYIGGMPQPPRLAAQLLATLAEAVHAAHQVGIVHRDLKPGNVLLPGSAARPPNREKARGVERPAPLDALLCHVPKIADFGLAKRSEADSAMTGSGEILGTPSYMAPEQARGGTKDVGPPADVHALGAILYELLTGRPPFRAATALDTLELVRSAEPVPPSRLQPKVPRDLETICLRCLQKAAARRFATADDLAQDLQRFLAGKPILARRISSAERLWKWARRRPAAAGLMAVSLLAAIGLLAIWARFTSQLQVERDYAQHEEALAIQQTNIANAQRDRAEHYLYNAQINLAQQAWQESHMRRLSDLLESLRPASGNKDWRGPEWYFFWRLCHSDLFTLAGHTRFTRHIAYSRDGRLLASAGDDELVILWDAITGRKLRSLREHGSFVSAVAFSPDSSQLVSGGGDLTIMTWDTTSGRRLLTLRGHEAPVYSVVFSPSGRQLASASRDGTVKVWDSASGDELGTLRGHSGPVVSVAYDAAGQRLVSGSEDKTVRIWDVGTQRTVITHTTGARVFCVAFCPDGSCIAAGGDDHQIRICSAATGDEIRVLEDHRGAVSGLAFGAGHQLATSSWDGTVRLWDTKTGTLERIFRGHLGSVLAVAFHPDGRHLASASQEIKLWDATVDQESLQIESHTGSVHSVAFGQDSMILASGGSDGTVRLWDTTHGAEQAVYRDHAGPVLGIAFSPDGQRLASAGRDRTVTIRTLSGDGGVTTLAGHTDAVYRVAFSPNGNRLASASRDQTVKIWDLAASKATATLRGHASFVQSVAFSPSGRRIASGGWNGTVKVWDVETSEQPLALAGHDAAVLCVAFSLDGAMLASAGEDNLVKLWSMDDGRLVGELRGHAGAVTGVSFHSGGKRLASCGGNPDQPGELKLWDTATGQELLTLRGRSSEFTGVAFSGDGQSWASADLDGIVYIWHAPLSARP